MSSTAKKGPDRTSAATTRFSTDVLHTATTSWLEHGKTTRGVDELLTGSTLDYKEHTANSEI